MEYHEIGERFEYNGVVLEVIEAQDCAHCFFNVNRICKLKSKLIYISRRKTHMSSACGM